MFPDQSLEQSGGDLLYVTALSLPEKLNFWKEILDHLFRHPVEDIRSLVLARVDVGNLLVKVHKRRQAGYTILHRLLRVVNPGGNPEAIENCSISPEHLYR